MLGVAACGSKPVVLFGKGPRVALIDNFSIKTEDVNGDGVYDASHGLITERLILSHVPDARIIRFELKSLFGNSMEPVARYIKSIADKTRSRRFDAVCIPLESHLQVDNLRANQQPMSPDQLGQYREGLFNHFRKINQKPFKGLGALLTQMARVTAKGIPVFVGGGNRGAAHFNLLNLVPGVNGVGATDANGISTFYTADNPLLNYKVQGTFAVSKVQGGYDLIGNGKAVISDQEVPQKAAIVSRFVGKDPTGMVYTEPEIQKIGQGEQKSSPRRLFTLTDYDRLGAVTEGRLEAYRMVGDYVLRFRRTLKYLFTKDAVGKLAFDPDGSKRPGAVSEVMGTSYATAHAVGLFLSGKLKPLETVPEVPPTEVPIAQPA